MEPTALGNLTASMHVVLSAASFSGSTHPNKMKFKGVLVRLDEASDKPPGGAEGHRILLPADVARKRLKTLVGMGLNYSPSLDGHAQRRKVGVIEDAGIEGRDLWVEGYVWKHDFPEAEEDLKQTGLGMSMELGDVKVENPHSDVWKLTDCCFLGGTILWKGKAAYHKTRAIAAAKQGGAMKPGTQKKKPVRNVPPVLDEAKIAKIAASAAATAMGEVITGTLKRQTEILSEMKTTLEVIAAGPEDEDEEEVVVTAEDVDANSDEEEEVAASDKSKKGEEDDEDDGDEDEEDDEDDDDVDATSSDGKPGELNDDAENQGDKTTEDDNVGPTKKEPITGAAVVKLRRENKNLRQKIASLEASNGKLTKQMKRLSKQVTAASEQMGRSRVIPSDVVGLLAKANINASELQRSGQKLGTSDVDAVIAAAETSFGAKFSNEQRITFKNKIYNCGLAEDGEVVRYAN